LTRLDTVVGTPEYMSPEQCAGKETGPASDRYSFGVVAYEALTGHVPYQAETPAAVMIAQMQSPLPDPRTVNPAINENVERALFRALAKDPEQRFPSCSAFVRALAATDTPIAEPRLGAATVATAPAPAPAVPVPAAAPTGPPPAAARTRTPLLIGAAVLVVLLALGGVLYAVNANRSPHSTAAGTAGPAHGSLIYEADLAHGGWNGGAPPSPNPDGSISLANATDGLTLKVLQDDASLSGEFDGPGLKNYVAHVVLRADSGTDMEFDWAVRSRSSTETADVFLSVQVSEESMTLFLSPDGASNQALTAALSVPGLQAGTTMDLWIVVNGSDIQLYLGSKKVADVHESNVSGATTPNFYLQGKKNGAMHVLTVAYYAVS
jgi:hypothetical protein